VQNDKLVAKISSQNDKFPPYNDKSQNLSLCVKKSVILYHKKRYLKSSWFIDAVLSFHDQIFVILAMSFYGNSAIPNFACTSGMTDDQKMTVDND
jgi:hypothetical protein